MLGYGEEQNKMSLFHKEGETYFAPMQEKRQKINNIHAWDKAFRVFVAIYTEEFPQKTTELMQYVQNIHHAAGKYRWDNVAYYDYVFRKLMEQYPQRSWAKTYTQGWTFAMCEPLQNRNPDHGTNFSNRKDKKNKVCWRFNRGICDYGDRCRYPHRCSSCGSTSHGVHVCHRKQRKSESRREDRHHEDGRGGYNGPKLEKGVKKV